MQFERYERPESIEDCIRLLRDGRGTSKILAGGTDLIVKMRAGQANARSVVDITRIPELQILQADDKEALIGAAVSLRRIQQSEALAGAWAVLCSGAGHVSSWQIRNLATLGGNVCNASPSADTVPALVLLDTKAQIQSQVGQYERPVQELFLGPGKIDLAEGAVLTGFRIPAPGERSAAVYLKHAIRGDSDISIIGAGVLLQLDEHNQIQKAKIALASAAPTVLIVPQAQELLVGELCSPQLFEAAAVICAEASQPIDDQRSSADYRRKMIHVKVYQALCQAAGQVSGF